MTHCGVIGRTKATEGNEYHSLEVSQVQFLQSSIFFIFKFFIGSQFLNFFSFRSSDSILTIFHGDYRNSDLEFFFNRYQFFSPILMDSLSHQFSQLPHFFINTKCDQDFEVGKLFLKNWYRWKNFLCGILVPKFSYLEKRCKKVVFNMRSMLLSMEPFISQNFHSYWDYSSYDLLELVFTTLFSFTTYE